MRRGFTVDSFWNLVDRLTPSLLRRCLQVQALEQAPRLQALNGVCSILEGHQAIGRRRHVAETRRVEPALLQRRAVR